MQNKNWLRIKKIFNDASDLPAHERVAFVHAHSGEDKEIEDAVLSMLSGLTSPEVSAPDHQDPNNSAIKDNDDSFTNIVSANASSLMRISSVLTPGQVIEHFTVMSIIGEGGMGSVFLAQRCEGDFEQFVAIKVVHKQHISEQSIQRFKRERQILASLNHKNIASFIGGGETEQGQAYIILEYVKGIPITEYCQQHKLSINSRLQLFNQVLSAVNYAHQNLVVHRDIKPSNVLVTESGDVKLLDFGIAKLLQDEQAASNDLTLQQMRVLTPGNAAPEQLLGEQITTRTDVYGLGTLLMHLLTDQAVFASTKSSPKEIENFILEKTPAKPSAVCEQSSLLEMKKRASVLKGDLDTIIMKTLQKTPDRRYSSVEQLIDDLARYHANYPITAKPDSLWYRAQKFVKRNTLGASFSFVLLLGVVSFLIVVYFQSIEIKQQRDSALEQAFIAQQTATFMTDMFDGANPYENHGNDVTAKTLVTNAVESLNKLDSAPTIKSKLLLSLAVVHNQLGEHRTAEKLLIEASELSSEHPFSQADLQLLNYLDINLESANTQINLGNYPLAQNGIRAYLAMLDDPKNEALISKSQDNFYTLYGFYNLANALEYNGQSQVAAEYYQKTLDMLEHESDPILQVNTLLAYGGALRHLGKNKESKQVLLQGIKQDKQMRSTVTLDRAYGLNQLASTLINLNELDDALVAAQEGFEIRQTILGDDNFETVASMGMLSKLYSRMDKLDQAILLRETINQTLIRTNNQTHPFYAANTTTLASFYLLDGRYEQASEMFHKAYDLHTQAYPEGHYNIARPLIDLGRISLLQKDIPSAKKYLVEAVSITNKHLKQDHFVKALANAYFSFIEYTEGEQAQASIRMQEAEAMYVTLYGQDSRQHTTFLALTNEIKETLGIAKEWGVNKI